MSGCLRMETRNWYRLLREVDDWNEPRVPPRSVVRKLAERYGEDEEYVRILFKERVVKFKQQVVEGLPEPTRRFLDEFGWIGRERYLARHTRLPVWAIREWRKRRNGRRELQ